MSSLFNYEFRKATAQDVEALKVIEIKANTRFGDTGLLDDMIDATMCSDRLNELIDLQQVWVACERQTDAPVGFAAASSLGKQCLLEEIDVAPEHGRRGIAKQLIAEIISWARSKNYSALLLSTFKAIPWNEPFYERLGFRSLPESALDADMMIIRQHEVEAGLEPKQRVFMTLDLNGSHVT